MARHLRQSCISIAGKERFLTFPKRLVTVHSRTVIAKQRLRHECRRLPKLVRSIANYVFKYLKIIGRSQHGRKAEVDFTLTGNCDFVMMTFDSHATLTERQR